MTRGELHARLVEIMDAAPEAVYNPGYRDGKGPEALGVLLAHLFKWDGYNICRAFAASLEDANFHTEAAQVFDYMEAIDAGEGAYGFPEKRDLMEGIGK